MKTVWKDRRVSYSGDYPRVYWPQHPMADGCGMLKIHRAIVAEKVGRYLTSDEIVHHKDEDRNNWSLDNLELTNLSDHSSHHHLTREYTKQYVSCCYCGNLIARSTRPLNKYNNVFCKMECSARFQEKIEWPTQEELSKLVWELTMVELSKILGVSDRAIKKRCVKLNIQTPPRGYFLRK